MAEFLFYALSALTVLFGIGVVASRQPMMSILSLLGSFVCLGVIYLLAHFQFMAAAQLIVYAGAIMVLFLFVVMLLDLANVEDLKENAFKVLGGRRIGLAFVVAAGLGVVTAVGAWGALRGDTIGQSEALPGAYDPIAPIAALIFTRYILVFEAAGLLLVATMVAVMVLAKRQRDPIAPRR